MLSHVALSWGVVAKSYKHGMVICDISCCLFGVSWFLDDGTAYKRASCHAKFILALTSSSVEEESQDSAENPRINTSG